MYAPTMQFGALLHGQQDSSFNGSGKVLQFILPVFYFFFSYIVTKLLTVN